MNGATPIEAAVLPDFRAASGFPRSVFNGQEHGILALFCKPGKVAHFTHLDRDGWQHDAAISAVQPRKPVNMYFAIGVQGGRPGKGCSKPHAVDENYQLLDEIKHLGAGWRMPLVDLSWNQRAVAWLHMRLGRSRNRAGQTRTAT